MKNKPEGPRDQILNCLASQVELADKAKVSVRTIQRTFERDVWPARPSVRNRIKKALMESGKYEP